MSKIEKDVMVVARESASLVRNLSGGLLGVSILAIFEGYLGMTLDTPLLIGLILFSLAIPWLSMSTFLSSVRMTPSGEIKGGFFPSLCFFVGVILSFGAMSATFWHFSWFIAVVFWINGILLYLISEAIRKSNVL